jgi:hypothetical protein
MNAHAVLVEERYRRLIMSSFHGLFSLGGLFGAALAGGAMTREVQGLRVEMTQQLQSLRVELSDKLTMQFRWLLGCLSIVTVGILLDLLR